MSGTLYVVPTPLGDDRDLSPRAVEVLRSVDLIAAEDTRTTLRLLQPRYRNDYSAITTIMRKSGRPI